MAERRAVSACHHFPQPNRQTNIKGPLPIFKRWLNVFRAASIIACQNAETWRGHKREQTICTYQMSAHSG